MIRKYESTRNFLKSAREKKCIPQRRVAYMADTHFMYVSNFERGLCSPSKNLINAYSAALKIDLSKIRKHIVNDEKKNWGL